MRRRVSLVGVVALVGVLLGLAPVEQAAAAGGANIQFDVDGTLPLFPCEENCPIATFEGTGTGGGGVTFEIDGVTHVAEFTVAAGQVEGSVIYSEPGFPQCPLVGSANTPTTGSVTLSGNSTGVISRVQTGPTLPSGTVSEASITLGFSYLRVGATPVIEVLGGSVTLEYNIPFLGPETRTYTEPILAGEGVGVFDVNAQEAAARCSNPDELDFRVIGDLVGVSG